MKQDLNPNDLRSLLQDGAAIASVRFPQGWQWKPELKNATFTDVDFNAPLLSGKLFSASTVTASRFVNANLDGFRSAKVVFEDCEFDRCVLGKRLRSAAKDTVFRRCRFTKCTFEYVSFNDCTFDGCELVDLAGKECRWDDSTFRGVTASGVLRGSTIHRCTMTDVDLSSMRILDSNLIATKLERVRLPERPDNFVLSPAAFRAATPKLEGRLTAQGRREYDLVLRALGDETFQEIVDESRFEALPKEDRRVVMETLFAERTRPSD